MIKKLYKMHLNKDKIILIKILMLKNNNGNKKENKFKKYVILSFKKAWEKVEVLMMKRIAILKRIFDYRNNKLYI
jgi:hypothetical protein